MAQQIRCEKCLYQWVTKTKFKYVTCPSCMEKTLVPKKPFDKKESYTHLYAKQLLAEWLKHGFTVECNGAKIEVKEGSQGIEVEYPITESYPYLPEEVGKTTDKWLAVADVATIHKGIVSCVFEVVNKNEEIDEKIQLYSSKNGLAFFINASHILGQIMPPDNLQAVAMVKYGRVYRD